MKELNLKNGETVKFETQTCRGTGKVVGVASIGVPFIGRNIILTDIKSESLVIPNPTYPFEALTIPEIFLKKIN